MLPGQFEKDGLQGNYTPDFKQRMESKRAEILEEFVAFRGDKIRTGSRFASIRG